MDIEVIEEPVTALADYAGIPIAFEVREVFDVHVQADGRYRLDARRLSEPYVKDYDAIGDGPRGWAERFVRTNWGLFSAFSGGARVGRAAVNAGTTARDRTLAHLWDIRVAPAARRCGVGAALFEAAARWAASRGCRRLEVETQNINVAACRFYAAQGCVLGAVHRDAYPDLADEIQLLWFKNL